MERPRWDISRAAFKTLIWPHSRRFKLATCRIDLTTWYPHLAAHYSCEKVHLQDSAVVNYPSLVSVYWLGSGNWAACPNFLSDTSSANKCHELSQSRIYYTVHQIVFLTHNTSAGRYDIVIQMPFLNISVFSMRHTEHTFLFIVSLNA